MSDEERIEDNTIEKTHDESIGIAYEQGNLLYESRMRELIKNVAEHEGFGNIRIGNKGGIALQNALRFITVMFTYELLDILTLQKKITVSGKSVNDTLTKLLGRTDSFNVTIHELESLIANLQHKSNDTSITKAMDFVNIIDGIYNTVTPPSEDESEDEGEGEVVTADEETTDK
ncbi:hypothetical protein [Paenibacillus macquariensis]|uniref:Uncharacterized protein n=1 Tax=Paenibacillus macquariensis TaxID=948756 RepID=A0ABY1JK88_9BACL|nr:hypothetical protein [Paenibacillus macquariensis]MEC0089883.1 hypothetical protein [Paenibacillus macquariensis]OAB30655.1 hypothetical protein PMSM_21125 [Paenibacillus macquariensis subsp. macquariensis]SIQ33446.1 hypothetical protein SAMN05421578_101267 [Paenibacillus macquariensis]